MSKQELIDEVTKNYKWAMREYLKTDDPEERARFKGMLLGYKSSLILIRTLED
jgi:hypothetical protein